MATAREVARLLARGGRLTRQEEEEVAAFLAINDITRAWVKDGTGIPRFPYFEAGEAHFDFNPMDVSIFSRQSTNQSIPSGVNTPISFELRRIYEGPWGWDSQGDTSIIRFDGTQGARTVFWVCGTVEFDTNASGYRRISIEEFDRNSNSLGSVPGTITSVPPVIGEHTHVNYSSLHTTFPSARYLRFNVEQNSGQNLDVISAFLWLARFR